MSPAAAFLCDAANIREGLLNAIGAGLARVRREEFPAPMGVAFAILLSAEQADLDREHEAKVTVHGLDSPDDVFAELSGQFRVESTNADPELATLVPLIFSLHGVQLPSEGLYEVRATVDEHDFVPVRLRMEKPPMEHQP